MQLALHAAPPELIGPDIVQRAVAQRGADLAASMRFRDSASIDRLVQDVQRVVHLPADRFCLLRVAAAGLVEAVVDESADRLQQDLQRHAQNGSAKTINNMLSTVTMPYQSRRNTAVKRWPSMMKRLLTAEEYASWSHIVDSRTAYRAHALMQVVAMLVQPRAKLSDAVMEQLKPLLEKSVQDYLPDIYEWSGDEIYQGYLPVFILGIPEAEARKIVPKERWDDWHRAAGDGLNMWAGLLQNHKSRLQAEKLEGTSSP